MYRLVKWAAFRAAIGCVFFVSGKPLMADLVPTSQNAFTDVEVGIGTSQQQNSTAFAPILWSTSLVAPVDPNQPRPTSQGDASLSSTIGTTSYALHFSGDSSRGDPVQGNAASADSSSGDSFAFNVTQSTPYVLQVTLTAATSEPVSNNPIGVFAFGASNGGVIGVSFNQPRTLTSSFSNNSALSEMIQGVLSPGSYSISMFGQSTANNAYPFQGSYSGSAIFNIPKFTGDSNFDGVIDIQDLTTVANHWQQQVAGWTQGDFDGNGVVDIQDLTAVANNWQAGVPTGGGSGESFSEALAELPEFGASSSVPEPASLSLLVLGGVMVGGRRRGRR